MSLTLIESKTLSTNTTEVIFSNIPQTYKSLYVVGDLKSARSGIQGDFSLKLNGTTSGYEARRMTAYGNSPQSDSAMHVNIIGTGGSYPANVFSSLDIYIANYNQGTMKGINMRTAFYDMVSYASARWTSGSAITSLTIYDLTGNAIVANSSLSLYGVS